MEGVKNSTDDNIDKKWHKNLVCVKKFCVWPLTFIGLQVACNEKGCFTNLDDGEIDYVVILKLEIVISLKLIGLIA